MDGYLQILNNMADFEEIIEGLKKKQSPVSVMGVSDSVRAHLSFCVAKTLDKNVLMVTANEMQARAVFEDMKFFFEGKVLLFPGRDLVFYDIEASANDIKKQRLDVIDKLAFGKDRYAVVTTASALLSMTAPKSLYQNRSLCLKVGDEIELEELCRLMVDFGYKRENMVEGPGQFSVRGGIFDYFPYWSDMPYRIEFFDTVVDSVRRFYTETQRTDSDIPKAARITPADEIVTDETSRKAAAGLLKNKLALLEKKKEKTDSDKKQIEILNRDIERIAEGTPFPSRDKYIPQLYGAEIPTLIDYFDQSYITFLDDPAGIYASAKAERQRLDETLKDLLIRGVLTSDKMKYNLDYAEGLSKLQGEIVTLCPLSHSSLGLKPRRLVSFTAKSLNSFGGKMEFFYDALKYYRSNKYRIIILAGSGRRADNLFTQLQDEEIACTRVESFDELPTPGSIVVTKGGLSRGFEYPLVRTVVISDKEIFGQERRKRKRFKVDKKNKIDSFTELSVGDFVVHKSHGIGQYMGLNRLTVENSQRDYLKIVYRGGDFLYVPADQLDMIYKHSSNDGAAAKLSRLGGQDWNKAKQKVKMSCQDMAKELVELYAQRESIKGIEFSADTEWQRDFEAAFPYDETDDQLKCIAEIKRDMEKPHPMERLLCGDVGYGKTEVAMRAAFKAVMDGYQVAYLVPTTILASQHYNNFRQRMKDYPINITMLSRFCTAAQQKNVLKALKSGEADIVIGTHKILQKSVEFKGLGLLIIDEEQRFGVAHKERIKEMKKEIDVLTLTATPIPRTLYMSMTGIRDMSIIEEPPQDRYPVATYVLEYDENVIRDAIIKELERGGQVYYLKNRVQGIEKLTAFISELVPEARVGMAHGKMTEHELENIMQDMAEGELDVLVCTTIIETGLDIPNVNTIIMEDADRLGLAQLYQLRGRVGRSNRLAYAYLTYKRDKALSEEAQKRLKAIREFTEFGSGFKIAMRDLEIRGTGNVIGPQQSGHMESVGYEMYCKLLEDTVKEMRGIAVENEVETSVNLPVSAYIPEEYISSHGQRIGAYKKIAAIETNEDFADVYDELLDRYGDVPGVTENLMNVALIKHTASKKKFNEIKGERQLLTLVFDPNDAPDLSRIVASEDFAKGVTVIKNGNKPKIHHKMPRNTSAKEYLQFVKEFIEKL